MNVDELLDLMVETMEDGMVVPLGGGKRVVDVEKLRGIINDVRENLPDEIRQARNIVADRAKILADAKAESEEMIKKSEERARAMVEKQEVTRAAEQYANEIRINAQAQARELTNRVAGYCENMLKNTEDQMVKSVNEVRNLRTSIRQVGKK